MFALFCPIHHYNGLLHWRSPQQQPWLRSQKREINQYTNVKLLNTTKLYKHRARHCISLRNRSLHPLAMFLPTKHPSTPWVPEAFYARFLVSVKSEKVTSAAASVFGLQPNTCRPAADKTKLPVEREKKPLVPRVTLLRFFSNFEKDQWENIHGHCWKQSLEIS